MGDKYTLKQWRMLEGMSQKELADKVGVSHVTISKYESGGLGSANVHTLIALLMALNIKFNQLNLEENNEKA